MPQWGIDYLKYDLCGLREQMKAAPSPEAAHQIMIDAYLKMEHAPAKDRPAHRVQPLPVRQ